MGHEVLKEASFDEVFDSQRCFKILMDAMSRPGQVFRLQEHHFSKSPEGFNSNILTILKTLEIIMSPFLSVLQMMKSFKDI